MIFFTADSHFSDPNIIKREFRRFDNTDDMVTYIINLWNKIATEDDIIYHLGDFISYGYTFMNNWQYDLKLVSRINAKVHLIIGNNEERLIRDFFNNDFEKFREYCLSLGFKDVSKKLMLKTDPFIWQNKTYNKIYLIHEPEKSINGECNLFGHVHCVTGRYARNIGICVCCDLYNMGLVSMTDLKELFKDTTKYLENAPSIKFVRETGCKDPKDI